jgi:type II secretory pathway pseudopilin PulG
MALINCSECGHEVSDKAASCPNCGAPIEQDGDSYEGNENKQGLNPKTKAIIAVVAALVMVGWVGSSFLEELASHRESQLQVEDFSKQLQEARKEAGLAGNPLEELETDVVTKAEYDRLTPGISYSEARSIIGASGEELSRVEIPGAPVTVVYSWQNKDGSNMNATFQDDKLTVKAQFGL